MKNSKIGFLSPANMMVWVEYNQVNNLCKSICEHDQCRERFESFKEDYNYFNPYFDFVMFELGFIMINGLCRNSCIIRYKDALYEILNTEDLVEYDYDFLKSSSIDNHSIMPLITRCSDSELRIHEFSDDDIETCMIDQHGTCMMSYAGLYDDRGSHDVTCQTVLNQMLSDNKEILDEYLMYEDNEVNYLINCLGFVKSTSKEDCGLILGNSTTMNDSIYQTFSLLDEFTFIDYSKSEETRQTWR